VSPLCNRGRAIRLLSDEYNRLVTQHYKSAPRNGIPVGGGDWMDSFFRLEGVRGTLGALGRGESLNKAIEDGKALSEIAIRIWNQRREWQVHRWDKCCHDYLDSIVRRIKCKPKKGAK